MRYKKMKMLSVTFMVVLLTACGNNNSKVDQVIQSQIEANNVENDSANGEGINEVEMADVITENAIVGTEEENQEDSAVGQTGEGIDVDLTTLSSTMVYSEVFNMMTVPEDYIGKKVKMTGSFAIYEDEETGQIYYACIISDATACCSQGIEFALKGDYAYPDDYPELESEITVIGEFETYEEDGTTYCRLKDAKLC